MSLPFNDLKHYELRFDYTGYITYEVWATSAKVAIKYFEADKELAEYMKSDGVTSLEDALKYNSRWPYKMCNITPDTSPKEGIVITQDNG